MIKSNLKVLIFTLAVMTVNNSLFAQLQETSQQQKNMGQNYAIVISGLGGSMEYTEKFKNHIMLLHNSLTVNFGFETENVRVLTEQKISEMDIVDDVSLAENIEKHFGLLAQKVTRNDNLFIFLFGHGSYNGTNGFLNIPRKDMSDEEYGKLVDKVDADQVVFVNCASASAPFIDHLSKSGRVVITATKSGTQKNQPLFAENFVGALSDVFSDLDKNGDISVLEIFKSASESTERWFEENKHLATEHSQIEDTGDRISYRAVDLEGSGEGNFAESVFFKKNSDLQFSAMSTDTVLIRLSSESRIIGGEIATLKASKNQMDEDDYYDELEVLMVKLAEINAKIEERIGKKDK